MLFRWGPAPPLRPLTSAIVVRCCRMRKKLTLTQVCVLQHCSPDAVLRRSTMSGRWAFVDGGKTSWCRRTTAEGLVAAGEFVRSGGADGFEDYTRPKPALLSIEVDGERRTVAKADYVAAKTKQLAEFG